MTKKKRPNACRGHLYGGGEAGLPPPISRKRTLSLPAGPPFCLSRQTMIQAKRALERAFPDRVVQDRQAVLYKSPANLCLPCRRCLPYRQRQTTPTRQTDLSSDRSYELRAHLSPPFPGADLYNSRPVLYNSLRGREAICTTHSERCVVFVAEELFCLNHRHFEADSFGYRRSPPTRFLLPSQGAGKEY